MSRPANPNDARPILEIVLLDAVLAAWQTKLLVRDFVYLDLHPRQDLTPAFQEHGCADVAGIAPQARHLLDREDWRPFPFLSGPVPAKPSQQVCRPSFHRVAVLVCDLLEWPCRFSGALVDRLGRGFAYTPVGVEGRVDEFLENAG